jgi:hypothetical protein
MKENGYIKTLNYDDIISLNGAREGGRERERERSQQIKNDSAVYFPSYTRNLSSR